MLKKVRPNDSCFVESQLEMRPYAEAAKFFEGCPYASSAMTPTLDSRSPSDISKCSVRRVVRAASLPIPFTPPLVDPKVRGVERGEISEDSTPELLNEAFSAKSTQYVQSKRHKESSNIALETSKRGM